MAGDRRYLKDLTLLEVAKQRKLRHDGGLSHSIRYLNEENSSRDNNALNMYYNVTSKQNK